MEKRARFLGPHVLHLGDVFPDVLRPVQGHSSGQFLGADGRGVGDGGWRIWDGASSPRGHRVVPLGGVLGFAAVGFSGDVGFAVANVVWLTRQP